MRAPAAPQPSRDRGRASRWRDQPDRCQIRHGRRPAIRAMVGGMELYYSPFACSLAPHIVCREAHLPVTLRRVDLATKRAEGSADFLRLNPLAQVPTLVLDDGQVLTENLAVLLWLGTQAADGGLVPPPGTPESYQVLRWLSFVSTELHKHVLFRMFALTAV